jgi:hypothetical protein
MAAICAKISASEDDNSSESVFAVDFITGGKPASNILLPRLFFLSSIIRRRTDDDDDDDDDDDGTLVVLDVFEDERTKERKE